MIADKQILEDEEINVVYCDGSLKPDNTVVVGILIGKLDKKYHSVREIVVCYKSVYHIDNKKDNVHELLAQLESMKLIMQLNLKNNTIIVNDSIADVLKMQQLKEHQDIYKISANQAVIDLFKEITNHSDVQVYDDVFHQVHFLRQPRTCLGLNIADYLNKETHSWTNEKDKQYLKKNIEKLLRRRWDYNISSKKKEDKSVLSSLPRL